MKRERLGDDSSSVKNDDSTITTETLRAVSTTKAPPKSDEEHLPVFWRLFGGTILSIAALAVITMYNQLSTNISELRTELDKVKESRLELVKKDDIQNRFQGVGERLTNVQTQQTTFVATLTSLQTSVDSLKERLLTYRSDADGMRKETNAILEKTKGELATNLDVIRKELDTVKKEVTQLDATRVKLTELAAELKAEKSDSAKLRQDVESNRVQDLERKKLRDEQYVKMTETLKELERAIRDNSEKLARLEGQITPKPKPTPANTRTESANRLP